MKGSDTVGVNYIYPEFEVVRDQNRCIACRVCERQCANEVHSFDAEGGVMISDSSKCVDCQRCVSLCPSRALKIEKSTNTFRENANWSSQLMKEVYLQAQSGGVLLSSMGNPAPLPVYWDKILINASQVTNPPIDPLREPMETRVFLGAKPENIRAAIGPNIGMCHFETDHDVPDAMRAAFGPEVDAYIEKRGEKYHLDLKQINAMVLRRCGVEHIDLSRDCTVCSCDRFWSHRATGGERGSQGAVIVCQEVTG